ncbi:MAG: hypothetical protein PHQ11_16675, partial [Paludibacter sp.]|nr:hypothetical protein [Paludibacter sp.]
FRKRMRHQIPCNVKIRYQKTQEEKMSESTIHPQEIEIDTIKNGVARLLCHWNIESVLHEDVLIYQYEEAVIKWALPLSFISSDGQTIVISTREDVEAYIQANSAEIMSFAKATKLEL